MKRGDIALLESRINVLVEERRQKVLELVNERGFIALADLATEVQVSESTLRRDLDHWEELGLLRRTHGGAATTGDGVAPSHLPALEDRATTCVAEKRQIARTATQQIQDGSSILLDAGTTTLELGRLLMGRPLQVVTNSLPIAALLSQGREPDVILLGGFVYPRTGVALGPATVEQLRSTHVTHAFLSCHGITKAGLFNHNMLLVETQRAMLKSAEQAFVLADHTKLGRHALTLLCPLNDVDALVIDDGISASERHWLEESGARLIVGDGTGDKR
jgi:DeoR/GlpR family transcriptional regulator of sugar metabolism